MNFDFKESHKNTAIAEIEALLEEAQENKDSIDVHIETGDNYEVMGAILAFFDDNEIDHQVELGGIVRASLE